MKKILITGSSGLIGSEVFLHFASLGGGIHGLDNNQRAIFFGTNGGTRWNQSRLRKSISAFNHHEVDIRDRKKVLELISTIKPDAIVYAAAKPSYDRSASTPFDRILQKTLQIYLQKSINHG